MPCGPTSTPLENVRAIVNFVHFPEQFLAIFRITDADMRLIAQPHRPNPIEDSRSRGMTVAGSVVALALHIKELTLTVRLEEIGRLVKSTSEPAFAVDRDGLISAWNETAQTFFGLPESEALGRGCWSVIKGSDDCGFVCSADCVALRTSREPSAIAAFDLKVETVEGKRWCNACVLRAEVNGNAHLIHILSPIDLRKRLELMLEEFVARNSGNESTDSAALLGSDRDFIRDIKLTPRERDILQLLARSHSTKEIAIELDVSLATVNNHIHHLLQKLNAHTRLEAVRRAEHAGLLFRVFGRYS